MITASDTPEQVDQLVLGMQGIQTPRNRGSFFHGRIKSYGAQVHLHIKHTHFNSQHLLAGPASNVSVHWLPGNQCLTINQGFPLVGFHLSFVKIFETL